MKRVFLLAASLLIFMTLLVSISTIYGRTIRASENWYASIPFTYSNGMPCPQPCLFGIRPGITKYDEVQAILAQHPLMHNISRKETITYTVYTYLSQHAALYIGFDQTVQWAEWVVLPETYNRMPQTPDLLRKAGDMGTLVKYQVPDAIRLTGDRYYKEGTRSYLNNALLVISHLRTTPATIAPTDPFYAITVYRDTKPTPTIINSPNSIGLMALAQWKGFGATSLYTNQN